MKKILLLLCAVALWSCTDYAADWDSKYENSFAANGESRICVEGETTIINQNECVTGFVCTNNSWIVSSGPQCQSASAQVCVEGSTTALVAGNCIVNYICSNNAWVQYGELQCVEVSAPKVCNEGEEVSLSENNCISNYVCSGNAWVFAGTSQCSSGDETSSKITTVSTTPKTSYSSCSKAFFCGKSGNTRVKTGINDGTDTYGYWFYYGDFNDGGDSYFSWKYGGTASTFVEKSVMPYGGIKGTANIGSAVEYPYLGLGFNIAGEKQRGDNITSWGGLCVVYQASSDFYLEVKPADETMTSGDNPVVLLPKGNKANTVYLANVKWDSFAQEGWGKSVSVSSVIKSAAIIDFKFLKYNSFAIIAIGKYGTCE